MVSIGAFTWRWMERWRALAFVIAGLLLLASPATKALALFVGVSLPTWLVVSLVFPGLLASMVGLLGLYPTLARQVPQMTLCVRGPTNRSATYSLRREQDVSIFPVAGSVNGVDAPAGALT